MSDLQFVESIPPEIERPLLLILPNLKKITSREHSTLIRRREPVVNHEDREVGLKFHSFHKKSILDT